MIGKIIGIEENTVVLRLSIDVTKYESLINIHEYYRNQGHSCNIAKYW